MAYIAAQPLTLLLVPILIGIISTVICALFDHRALCRAGGARLPPHH